MRQRTIIAMKGAPFTRKTEFACLIAASLKCPLLSVEDVMVAHRRTTKKTYTFESVPELQDHAFKIVSFMASMHMVRGIGDNLVIDSPLSTQSQLDRLIKIASNQDVRLVIVECKPKNVYSWEMKFENCLKNSLFARKWFQPKSWDDIQAAIKNDYDERSGGYKVPKLVLDPLTDSMYGDDIYYSIYHLPKSDEIKLPAFMEAVKYMMTRKEGEGPDVVVYNQWRQHSSCSSDPAVEIQKQESYCRDGHTITEYADELGVEAELGCIACGKEVKGAASYSCNNCRLALHKDCAESYDKNSIWPWGVLDDDFPEKLACTSCNESGKGFSTRCASCLFATILKCQLMPVVIRHDCDEHFLSIRFSSPDAYDEGYKCLACAKTAQYFYYSCETCGVNYHMQCLTKVPSKVKHEHGGYYHHMLLKFSAPAAEDYVCHECLEKRDPQAWYYFCEECQYEVELDCINNNIREYDEFIRTGLDHYSTLYWRNLLRRGASGSE